MASYTWVEPKDLVGSWIGAQPHQLEYVENRRRLETSGLSIEFLDELCSRLTQGPNPTYEGHDVRCLITRSVYDDELLIDDCNWISLAEFSKLNRYQLAQYDVLVTLKGIGACKVNVFLGTDVAIHSREVGVLRCRDPSFAPFMSAYLRCKYGKLLLRQGTLGTAQVTLATSYLKKLPIIKPDRPIRDYVGAKVELAERCRAEARRLEGACEELLSLGIGEEPRSWLSSVEFGRVFHAGGFIVTVAPNLLRDRLDPVGYHPTLLSVQRRARGKRPLFQPIEALGRVVTQERVRVGAEVEAFVSVLHVDDKGFLNSRAAFKYRPDNPGRQCMDDDVLISCINPAANRIAVCDGLPANTGCSPEFSIVRADAVSPHYLAFAVRSEIARAQLIHLGRGTSSSRRRVDERELMLVEVPVIQQHAAIGEYMKERQYLVAEANRFAEEAKADVESLVEGTLDTRGILSGRMKPPTAKHVFGVIKREVAK